MKKLLIILILLVACSPQVTPKGPVFIPDEGQSSSPVPLDMSPAQGAAIAALSGTLNLPAEQITLVSTEPVTWPNGCLGVIRQGVMCTQSIVYGFRITLEAEGEQYEFHTDKDGRSVLQAVVSAGFDSLEGAVRAQLASNLGLDENGISVVSDTPLEFADACLGVALQDVDCAQVLTPGHIIVLETNGVHYEYHTNEDGSRIQPATLVLTWKREGGIAGFCDHLTVYRSGEVTGLNCRAQPKEMASNFATLFSASQQKQFDAWLDKFGPVVLDVSDPVSAADGMSNILVFSGDGEGKPSPADEQALFDWVNELFQKLYS